MTRDGVSSRFLLYLLYQQYRLPLFSLLYPTTLEGKPVRRGAE
jgi:hypothetical protein